MSRSECKCPQCGVHIRYTDIAVHYAGKHWHISCLLDSLTEGSRPADKPLSLMYGGAGFHP